MVADVAKAGLVDATALSASGGLCRSKANHQRRWFARSKFMHSIITAILVGTLAGCAGQQGSNFRLPNPIAPLTDTLNKFSNSGRYWYRNLPGYRSISPYIADQERYADFVAKYQTQRNISLSESAEIIIQLGIPQYAPDWIKPEMMDLINRAMHNKYGSLPANTVQFAMSDHNLENDMYQDQIQVAFLPVLLFLLVGDAELIELVSFTSVITRISPALRAFLTFERYAKINSAMDDICKQPGMSCQTVTLPSQSEIDIGIIRPDDPGGGYCACNCRAMDPTNPSTMRFGVWTARTCQEAARQSCLLASNRAAVSNQHHVQAKCSDGMNYGMGGGLAR